MMNSNNGKNLANRGKTNKSPRNLATLSTEPSKEKLKNLYFLLDVCIVVAMVVVEELDRYKYIVATKNKGHGIGARESRDTRK